jgi:hypothetical protein
MQTYRLPVTLKNGRQVFLPIKGENKCHAMESYRAIVAPLDWAKVHWPRD